MAFIRFAGNNISRREDFVSRLQRKIPFLLLSVMAGEALPFEQRRNPVAEQIICNALSFQHQNCCEQWENLQRGFSVSHSAPLCNEISRGDDSRGQKYIIQPGQENDRVARRGDP